MITSGSDSTSIVVASSSRAFISGPLSFQTIFKVIRTVLVYLSILNITRPTDMHYER